MTEKKHKDRPLRVGLISLGCAKNLADAEIMLGTLLQDGVEITNDAAQADVVIVNTCSFIDAAQEESVDAILESAALRDAKRRGQGLIVAGCLPQRFRGELPKLLPEVDAFMGVDQVAQVTEIVRQAQARRAARIQKPKSSVPVTATRQSAAILPVHKGTAALGRDTATPPAFNVTIRPRYLPDSATPRFRLTPRHFAYLKIAEGCNHPCSFCIIPRLRGPLRSRPPRDLVAEARRLIAGGVKELNLISQDSTAYGLDLRAAQSGTGVPPVSFDLRQAQSLLKRTGGTPVPLRPSRAISPPGTFSAAVKSLPADSTTICALLRELNALPGDFWIRLLYTHPARWTDELIRTIAECPKVARYADIPLQHIHDNMLERMRRETSRPYLVNLLEKIRAGVPGIALRTTFIVGFPGETEASFQALLEFIRETKFERLGVFAYSREAGTRAEKMAGQIPDQLKQQRRDLAMAVQREVAAGVSASFVGRTLKVLVEGRADAAQLPSANIRSWEHGLLRETKTSKPQRATASYLVARGEADAPDIDGRIYVRGKLPLGQFGRVKIIGHTDYDLFGESDPFESTL